MNDRQENQIQTLYRNHTSDNEPRWTYIDFIGRELGGNYHGVPILTGEDELVDTSLENFLKRLAQVINHDKPPTGWSDQIIPLFPNRHERTEDGQIVQNRYVPGHYDERVNNPHFRHVYMWNTSSGERYLFEYTFWYVEGKKQMTSVFFYNMNGGDEWDSDNDTVAEYLESQMISTIQRLHERLSVLEGTKKLY